MFRWTQVMIHETGLKERAAQLGQNKRAAFAIMCALRALCFFQASDSARSYASDRSDFLPRLRNLLDESWIALLDGDASGCSSRLKAVIEIGEGIENPAYCEVELLMATEKALACQAGQDSETAMILAAKFAYSSVSKYYVAEAFPGSALTAELITAFESESPECALELTTQITRLKTIETRCVADLRL
jgi:hypothetical protein